MRSWTDSWHSHILISEAVMERGSKKINILEKACYLLTTLNKSVFSKVAGLSLQWVASFSTKMTFFTEFFSKIAPHSEINSSNSLKSYLHCILKNYHHLHYSLWTLSNKKKYWMWLTSCGCYSLKLKKLKLYFL